MENIIVTVTNKSKSFLCDLELPTTLTVDKLKNDIVEALNGYKCGLDLKSSGTVLFCNRIGRGLADNETLESVGIWNGDYITLMEAE